jgi:cell division protein ZipA
VAELRWLLLVVGLFLVAGIYLYSRFKPQFDRSLAERAARREPTLAKQPVAANPPELTAVMQSEVPELTSAPEVPKPPETKPKIVAIRLMSRDTVGFPGEKLILTMRELGLQPGDFGIFHRHIDDERRHAEFSIASMVEPGSFDLTKLKTDSYRGVSIFMQLPGTRDGIDVFDDMLTTSRSLAKRLDGDLLDEQGSTLSIQRERYLREEVIQFEHQLH